MVVLIILLLFILAFAYAIVKTVTRKPDYDVLNYSGSSGELVQTLINEINTALSLNQTSVIHKFNPVEPPIDGSVAAMVTFRVAMATPCIILFNYQDNGDVRIDLERMTLSN